MKNKVTNKGPHHQHDIKPIMADNCKRMKNHEQAYNLKKCKTTTFLLCNINYPMKDMAKLYHKSLKYPKQGIFIASLKKPIKVKPSLENKLNLLQSHTLTKSHMDNH